MVNSHATLLRLVANSFCYSSKVHSVLILDKELTHASQIDNSLISANQFSIGSNQYQKVMIKYLYEHLTSTFSFLFFIFFHTYLTSYLHNLDLSQHQLDCSEWKKPHLIHSSIFDKHNRTLRWHCCNVLI